jgi:hypothetical protein
MELVDEPDEPSRNPTEEHLDKIPENSHGMEQPLTTASMTHSEDGLKMDEERPVDGLMIDTTDTAESTYIPKKLRKLRKMSEALPALSDSKNMTPGTDIQSPNGPVSASTIVSSVDEDLNMEQRTPTLTKFVLLIVWRFHFNSSRLDESVIHSDSLLMDLIRKGANAVVDSMEDMDVDLSALDEEDWKFACLALQDLLSSQPSNHGK